ncbi:MAG TPA: DUF4126 domain-containing protein [Thermoanaerobaculia bacterium]|nr:DUF4126 domain-containing protein [Thermoanaerobaculia bacterium]
MSTLLTAIGLGLGAGVNAYATLLVFGLLSRWRPGLFEGDLATFFASTPVLITLGVLYAVEFVADKVPAIDHVWDAIHTFVRPAAGALVGWAASFDQLPQGAVVLATVMAGGAALTTHAAKASIRVASTSTTAGTVSPILSLAEDAFAIGSALIAIVLPWLVAGLIAIVAFVIFMLLRRYRKPQTL